MARFYANENFPLPVVEELRRLGHDVLTTQDTGRAGQSVPDDEVLAFAASQERTVITLNRKDYVELHRQAPRHSGIIVCTFDRDFIAQAQRIHTAMKSVPEPAGELIRVNRL